jgi:hypothetical protein
VLAELLPQGETHHRVVARVEQEVVLDLHPVEPRAARLPGMRLPERADDQVAFGRRLVEVGRDAAVDAELERLLPISELSMRSPSK